MQTSTQTKHTTQIAQTDIQRLTNTHHLPQPYPRPILQATFKNSPSEFQVDEVLDIDLSGEGEHLWLLIKKTGMNTVFVAQQLAKWANISNRDVGYSGLKDRHAVTTQWFSLRIPKGERPDISFAEFITASQSNASTHNNRSVSSANSHNSFDKRDSFDKRASLANRESVDVLEQVWHSKKLHKGAHKANRFVITLRNVILDATVAPDKKAVDKALDIISTQGVPNYFGAQRFGNQGSNIISALEWFEQGTINERKPHPKKSRDLQSILLSSARSAIYNQILAKRVLDSTWNTALEGDVFNLEGSGSVFTVEHIDAEINQRLATGDIHPTAPLWGIKNDKVTADAKALEEATVAEDSILSRLATGLEAKQIKTMRRALRLPVHHLKWSWDNEDTLTLDFTLTTGSFATSVLAAVVQQLDG